MTTATATKNPEPKKQPTAAARQQPTAQVDLAAEQVRQLLALTACASPDDARPVIATVLFDGRFAWATDSHILGRVDLGSDVDVSPSRFVSAAALAKALRPVKRTKRNPDQTDLEFTRDSLIVRVRSHGLFGSTEQTAATIPYGVGNYPDIHKLIPTFKGCEGEPPWLNPKNIEKIAALAVRNGSVPTVRLRWTDPFKPVVVEDGDVLLGLIMPVKRYT